MIAGKRMLAGYHLSQNGETIIHSTNDMYNLNVFPHYF